MGLDMYLRGRKFYTSYPNPRPKDDEGYDIESVEVELGYWRKHANLHGYIVKTYADGKDDCQEIELDKAAIEHLLDVVKSPSLMPKTEGFFFGESANNAEQIDDDTRQLEKALAFLLSPAITGQENIWRSVIYRASW